MGKGHGGRPKRLGTSAQAIEAATKYAYWGYRLKATLPAWTFELTPSLDIARLPPPSAMTIIMSSHVTSASHLQDILCSSFPDIRLVRIFSPHLPLQRSPTRPRRPP